MLQVQFPRKNLEFATEDATDFEGTEFQMPEYKPHSMMCKKDVVYDRITKGEFHQTMVAKMNAHIRNYYDKRCVMLQSKRKS